MSIITAICKCGKKIVWGQLEDGTKVPLDPAPPTYYIHGVITGPSADFHGNNMEGYRIKRANGQKEKAIGQAYVSHFVTCPQAENFSRSNRA